MAVNIQKFLPSAASKGGVLAKSQNISKGSSSLGIEESAQKNIGIISIKVIEIDKILKGTLASQKKQLDNQKRLQSSKRIEKQEEKLETKPQAEKGSIKMPKGPRLGIFDWIKNFIGNVLLGYFAVRLVDHLPKILPIVEFIGKAADFLIDVGGKLLTGLITFVDWGYKAYDATKGFIKNLFGDDGVKQFEQLSSLLNKFLNLALIAGMVAIGSGGFGGKGGRGKGGGGKPEARPRPGQGGRPKVTTSGGSGSRGLDIKNPLRQRPKVTSGGKPQLRLPGTGPKVTTGGGNKTLLASVRPFLKRIPLPVVGALIDFGLSVALGENPGRAAFRAIGAGLLGAVGASAGSVVPVAGNFIGGLLGGVAGDAIGGALYDAFFNGKISSKGKTVKKAGGGITRGGERQTGAKRTISKGKSGKYKRVVPRKPGEVKIKPGADVGGEDKIFGIFPNPFKKIVDTFNPFKPTVDAGKNLGKTDYFGPILAITSKIALGQKPSQKDYENVGLGINMLIGKGIQEKQLKGGLVAAFAEGGLVDPDIISAAETGGDISNWVATTFRGEIESNAQKTLREIRENIQKKDVEKEKKSPEGGGGGDGGEDGFEVGPAGSSGDKLTMSRNLMRDLGLTAEQAAGIVGNMAAESGVENARPQGSKPGTKGILKVDGKTGYGLVQWTSMGRQQALADFAKSRSADLNKPLSMDIEYQFFLKEFKGAYGKVLEQIKQAKDVKTASTIFMQQYEVPAGYKTEAKKMERYNMSKPIYDQLAMGGGKATEGKGTYIPPTGPSTGSNIALGKGYGSEGSKIAGELGRYVKKLGVVPGSIHEHPEFGGIKYTHARNSYHYKGRAIDLGAYAYEQGPVLKAIAQFNQTKGVKPVELLKAGDAGHSDHVHVAYGKGGETLNGPHMAMIGEKGREIVIDNDSVESNPEIKEMLLAINQASNYQGVLKAIQQYAPYDAISSQTIIIPFPMDDTEEPDYSSQSSGGSAIFAGGESDDPFKTLYQGT